MNFAGASLMILLSIGCPAIAENTPKADNTAQNRGVLQKDSVTADKQGNSSEEVTVLAEIRKAIMAKKGLSMDAQNVKIVYSKDGRVILRGPVDSKSEKAEICKLVKVCSGVTSVKNELTVAVKPH